MSTQDDAPSDDGPTCPICERPIESPESNETFPFCSPRCKRVDLSRWLDESYTIPMTPHDTERTLQPDDDDEREED